MRRISFLFSIIVIVLLFTNCTNDQTSNSDFIVTLEEAEQILLTEVFQDSTFGGIKVYEVKEPLDKYSSITSYDDTYTLTHRSWFFFIDDCYYANWAHPCRYVLINYYRNWNNYNYYVIDEQWPPNCAGEMVEIEFNN